MRRYVTTLFPLLLGLLAATAVLAQQPDSVITIQARVNGTTWYRLRIAPGGAAPQVALAKREQISYDYMETGCFREIGRAIDSLRPQQLDTARFYYLLATLDSLKDVYSQYRRDTLRLDSPEDLAYRQQARAFFSAREPDNRKRIVLDGVHYEVSLQTGSRTERYTVHAPDEQHHPILRALIQATFDRYRAVGGSILFSLRDTFGF
ncbi:MAG: hypothetical protein EOO16_07560 [Chitinophagaceae bacterium]|nr:MAG: hypothetical protein EOO16_07560 [Chitinophagaceae bacterium]